MKARRETALAAAILFLISSAPAWPWRPATKRTPPLTLWQVNNAEYQVAFDGKKHKLKNGKLVSGTVSQGNYLSIAIYKTAFGDLDGDETGDAAVLLAVNGGGTGTFHELAILANKGGKPVYAATKRGLGDRNIVGTLSITNRLVIIDMKVQGPADSLADPTKKVRWKFRLKWDKRNKYRVLQVQ